MKKQDYSKKIIRILGEKMAISLPELQVRALGSILESKALTKTNYAITRSLKGLREAGLVENLSSGQNDYARLTKEGKKKSHIVKLENKSAVFNPNWDGLWRIILLDLPENKKSERESLRYLLKKAGFVCLKNSAWISPYPFEHLFMNIKKDLALTTEFIIFTTSGIDPETEKVLFDIFKK